MESNNLKILLISNEYDRPGRIGNPIINRIKDSLMACVGVESVEFVPFTNSLKSFSVIRSAAKNADVIHIQFGGLYAFLIWFSIIGIRKPKLLTFHGTDIHAREILTTNSKLKKLKIWLSQKASFCSILIFDKLGFVTDSLFDYIPTWIMSRFQGKLFVQPLGVDYNLFRPMNCDEACEKLGVKLKKYVLFSDKSNTELKRRDIAESIVQNLGMEYQLLIINGVEPSKVPLYLNACDFVLLTSDEEGSPNIIREALSLNKRVFAVDVGDVRQQLFGLKNSAIISRDPKEAAEKIRETLKLDYIDNSRVNLKNRIDFSGISQNLVKIYLSLL